MFHTYCNKLVAYLFTVRLVFPSQNISSYRDPSNLCCGLMKVPRPSGPSCISKNISSQSEFIVSCLRIVSVLYLQQSKLLRDTFMSHLENFVMLKTSSYFVVQCHWVVTNIDSNTTQ